jgi:hypothetical protein
MNIKLDCVDQCIIAEVQPLIPDPEEEPAPVEVTEEPEPDNV